MAGLFLTDYLANPHECPTLERLKRCYSPPPKWLTKQLPMSMSKLPLGRLFLDNDPPISPNGVKKRTQRQLAKGAVDYSDEAGRYCDLKDDLSDHDFSRHGEAEKGCGEVPADTLDTFLSTLKRGIKCKYLHCSRQHFHR
jgi:hypothetical protein